MIFKISTIKSHLKSILSGKTVFLYLLPIVFVIYLPSMKVGFVLDDIWHRISHIENSGLDEEEKKIFNLRGPMRAYSILDGETERTKLMMNKGVLPWWVNTKTKINFWRPISAYLLELDYFFFPDNPGAMHLHSILWLLILIFLTGLLYIKIFGNEWYAGLSTILFMINGSFFLPVYWLANRHVLISAVFGVGSILLFVNYIEKRDYANYLLSIILFCFSILSSEMGILTFAFVITFLLFLNKESVSRKIRYTIPFIIILLLWFLIYNYLGYGVSSNELYINPFSYPIQFVTNIFIRFPFLVIGILGYPPAEFYLLLSSQLILIISAIFWLVIIFTAYFTRSFWFRNSNSLFWFFSAIFVLVPLCAIIPGNRDLGFAAIGAIGFIVTILKNFLAGKKVSKISFISTIVFLIYLGFTEIVLLPLKYFANYKIIKVFETNKLVNFANQNLNKKDVIIVNGYGSFIICYMIPNYLFNSHYLPEHIRTLSPGFTSVEFKRIDLNTIIVKPADGFYNPAGSGKNYETPENNNYISITNLLRRMERLPQDGTEIFKINQVISLPDVNVEIISLTKDGRPFEVKYRFAYPLEFEKYEWIIWDMKFLGYKQFNLPEIGETLKINNQDLLSRE